MSRSTVSLIFNDGMAQSRFASRLVVAPIDALRPSLQHRPGSILHTHSPTILLSHLHASTSRHLPRITQPTIWTSLIPKFLRSPKSPKPSTPARPKSKEWNPATFYIVVFLLIGSQAIQMIALRNEYSAFSRRADARIGLLKEAIERVQNGEDVDVKALLGTGDKAQEKEWEEGEALLFTPA
ncbi:hypothetical protein GP486_005644 [Trichoglossum hirsutum]|uniref:Uncharacterized protein n=1 Tax=Trichoglossum hirsutum TaxID=265104 RepID=A0A9P8RLV3_9PEZI|nr:hypothetical protein GP486_005644 [Trichoglossum hirsutum]